MKRKLSPEEAEEVAARKRHKSINQRIRGAKGVTVEVPIGTPKTNVKMGKAIRTMSGRTNGKEAFELMKLKRQAMEQGYIVNDEGEILHDSRTDAEREAQDGS